jgi:hypothetical protein
VVLLERDGDGERDDALTVPDGVLGHAGLTLPHPEHQVCQRAGVESLDLVKIST